MAFNQGCRGLVPKDSLHHKFLYYYLAANVDRLESLGTGATFNELAAARLKSVPIPLPPLAEQKRIVEILDEAFEAIDSATAHAERNVENAAALSDSFLDTLFEERGSKDPQRKLGDVCKRITVGHVGSMAKRYKDTGVPLLRSQNIRPFSVDLTNVVYIDSSFHTYLKKSELFAGDVGIVRTGYPGTAAVIPKTLGQANCSDLVIARPGPQIDSHYLAAFFNSPFGKRQVGGLLVGAAQKHFNVTAAKSSKIPLPGVSEQRKTVERFERLRSEVDGLIVRGNRKLTLLTELKQSLLHKAFKGELTAESDVPAPSPIPFPATLEGISTTDLHAGILALAYREHEAAGKLNDFGHVKGEKIAHMVEARLGIDLGRTPVKDAAGPNDYPHLKKVEHRAKMANYFDFKKMNGVAYRVQKLRSFDRLIEKSQAALGDRLQEVECVLRWMVQLKWRQAEIVATVYAAWNNLLLDGQQPTDEQIVYEARENWHPDKLKIPRERFFKALDWMRQEGVTPAGKGKRVDTA